MSNRHDLADDVRQDVADALHKLAVRRGAERDQHQVAHLLTAPLGKHQRASNPQTLKPKAPVLKLVPRTPGAPPGELKP
jgi:hypothetical protein